MKSFLAKPGEVGGDWHLVDADGKVLGRLATELATILMGKHKPTYTPHVLTGDFVVVINAEKVRLTGNKLEQKEYDRYTYYNSGRKVDPIKKVLATHPERVIWWAVRRMLPKNALGRHMLSRLKIYAGPQHPHQAQQPKPLEINV
ncbi:MAG TPA: 50S ribosomal protein L13 [Phycisphaerae bacterium]|jgi:large subunit ribosomal protein L13|nr:50S ribosomal protein L13 [Phycisphaerae bacterium]HOB73721.1 50S ribosomal protein L13 [Phycisphaerae bacterium]HOJ53405.1 50S ribosomal protein L13 [Phycisphaerae bacterium]HOL25471.1 50S ribosomal protein L13 [Phycisphaerae bacterium]HPP19852.1 50S ribosomal protein L13 [Phycisphaerae bacterium]